MNSDELRAVGALGSGLLLIGIGVSAVLGYVDLDSSLMGFVVSSGSICVGIAVLVYGFDFLFRPGEPGLAEERTWDRFKIVAVVFLLLGAALEFVAVVLILVQD
jgi:hypothetical protein